MDGEFLVHFGLQTHLHTNITHKNIFDPIVDVNRKLEEASSQNGDLRQMIAKREETILHNQVRLEEKSRECNALNRQLEEALEDARRQVCTFTTHKTS